MAKNSIGSLSVIISASTRQLATNLAQAQRMVQNFQAGVNKTLSGASSLASFVNPFEGMIPSFTQLKTVGVAALAGLSVYAVKLAADAEQTQVAFEVLIGDAEKATKLIGNIRQFAAETPFGSTEILDAARMLSAYGIAAEQIIPTVKALGEVTASLGGKTSINDIAYLYGTLKTQGKALTKDIREFTSRGVDLLPALAQAMKVSNAEVSSMVEEGKVGFREVTMAFKIMTESGGKYAGMMQRQSQTLAGMWEAFKDNAVIALAKVGQMLVEEFNLKGVLANLTEFARGSQDQIDKVRPIIQEVRKWFEAIGHAASVAGQTIFAFLDGLFTGLNRVFNLTEKAGSFRDWLSNLQVDLNKSRDVGVRFARDVSIAIGALIDVFDQLGLQIERTAYHLMKVDLGQFVVKAKIGEVFGSEARDKIALFDQLSRTAKKFSESPFGTKIDSEIIDLSMASKARQNLIERTLGINPETTKQLTETSNQLREVANRIQEIQEFNKANPDKALTNTLESNINEYKKLLTTWDTLNANLRTGFEATRDPTGTEEVHRMAKELADMRVRLDAKGRGVGNRSQEIAKRYDEIMKSLEMESKTKIIQEAANAVVTTGVSALEGATKGFAKVIQDVLEIPRQIATAEQIGLAKQLRESMNPIDKMKREINDLNQLLGVGAFGESQGAGLLGIPDPKMLQGLSAVQAEAGRQFMDLANRYGLGQPKLAPTILAGSREAASIEANFKASGTLTNQDVPSLLKQIKDAQDKQNATYEKIGRELIDELKKQAGGQDVK